MAIRKSPAEVKSFGTVHAGDHFWRREV